MVIKKEKGNAEIEKYQVRTFICIDRFGNYPFRQITIEHFGTVKHCLFIQQQVRMKDKKSRREY